MSVARGVAGMTGFGPLRKYAGIASPMRFTFHSKPSDTINRTPEEASIGQIHLKNPPVLIAQLCRRVREPSKCLGWRQNRANAQIGTGCPFAYKKL